MNIGENIDQYNLSTDEKRFMGFIVQQGTSGMRKTVSHFAGKGIKSQLASIANQLFKIKHWEIKLGCYTEIENCNCTWFIDPPYQYGGHEYKFSNKSIDFQSLSEWCKSRLGHVIVCENTKADWLPFIPMVNMTGSMFTTTEAIWTNHPTSYGTKQLDLFT